MIALYPTLSAKVIRTTRKTLSSGSALLFTGQMIGNFGAYIYHMIMARMMTPADYGSLVTLTSISVALTVVVRSIQAWAINSVSSAPEVSGQHVRQVLSRILRILLPATGITIVGFWIVSPWVASVFRLTDRISVIVLGLFICTSSLNSIPKGILLGVQRLPIVSIMYILNPLFRVLAGFVFVIFGLGVAGGLAAYAVGDIVVFCLAILTLVPLFRINHNGAVHDTAANHEYRNKFSLKSYPILVFTINACLVVLSTMDQLSVKIFFPPDVAGNFSVAFLLGRVIIMSAMAMGWVIFTRASDSSIEIARRARLLLKSLAVIGSFSLLLLLGYFTMPDFIVSIMSGAKYKLAPDYVGLVGIEVTLFSLIYIQAYYQMALRRMTAVWLLGLASISEITVVSLYHASVYQMMTNIILIMGILLVCVSGVSWSTTRDVKRTESLQGYAA